MRIVLDTNVFVSGVFWDGPPNCILKAWIAEKISLVLSLEILEEYQRIGHSLSLKYPLIDFPQVLTLLEANAEIVVSPKHHIRVCEDPDDDKFFSCALTAQVHRTEGIKIKRALREILAIDSSEISMWILRKTKSTSGALTGERKGNSRITLKAAGGTQ